MPNQNDGLTNAVTGGMNVDFSLIKTFLAAALGKWINDQNAKANINPKEGLKTINPYVTNAQNMVNEQQRGETQNPMLANARTTMESRVNTPVTPPSTYDPYKTNPSYGQTDPALMTQLRTTATTPPTLATQPTRFAPYKTNLSQGQLNPQLLQQAMSMATGSGGGNPTVNWGNNILQNSMANRFGTRDMRSGNVSGQLNPVPLPTTPTPTTPTNLGIGLTGQNAIDKGYQFGNLQGWGGSNPLDAILQGMKFGNLNTGNAGINPTQAGMQYGNLRGQGTQPNIQALIDILLKGKQYGNLGR